MSKPVICIGAALVDELFYLSGPVLPATTNIATATRTAGGVARNIAQQLAMLDVPVHLIAVLGNDSDGHWLKNICSDAGIHLDAAITINGPAGKYTGIIDSIGHLYTAFLTNAADHLITPVHLQQQHALLQTAGWLLADTNLSIAAIEWLIAFSHQTGIPLIIEPVSVPPAKKLTAMNLNGLYLLTPNEDELPAICSPGATNTQQQVEELLQRGVQQIWFHQGKEGSVLYSKDSTIALPAPVVDMVDCTGAGDGSLSGFILGKYLGKSDLDSLKLAHTLSAEIIKVKGSVAAHIDQQRLLQLVSNYYPS
jgi:pseudouridine kinase